MQTRRRRPTKKQDNELDTHIIASLGERHRHLIIKKLLISPCNTLDFRAGGIMSPAQRISELNKRGYVIESSPITVIDPEGIQHKNIALYTLISLPEEVE